MASDALHAYLNDRAAGKDALLIADTWEIADALNRRQHDTVTTPGPTAKAARDQEIRVGDVIMSRSNDATILVYGRSPVEALVAADYLSSTELGVVELTTLTGDLTRVSIDSLLSELRRRVLAANPEDTQTWPPGWSADNPGMGRHQNGEESGDLSG
jgi:hypothetical protein